jgi:hypothetical protein
LLALVLCVCVGKAVTIRPDKKVKRGT